MGLIVPAVLPSSRRDLAEKLKRFGSIAAVSRIQIDVVDGAFASPATWPYTAPSELRSMVEKDEMLPYLDRIAYEVDLMCLDAERAAADWLSLGASRLTLHAESIMEIPKCLGSMKSRYGDVSAAFGLALSVTSDLSLIEPCLDQVEYVQFMGIASIGKQGQLFDRRTLEKIRLFRLRHPDTPVQVDGGVTYAVAQELIALGVTSLVVGSALQRAASPAAEIERFEALQTPFGV